jgi:2-oxoglutarate dehydrogenase E2 component (dihydrolipoamide succinyltransferase)
MSLEIVVPALGESVTEAIIANVLVKVGDEVASDQAIIELETEKITLEVVAPNNGKITSILVAKGDTVKIGTLLGMLEPGEISIKPAEKTVEKVIEKSPDIIPSPAAKKIAAEAAIPLANIQGTGKDGRIMKGDVLSLLGSSKREERVPMTRLRSRIAQRLKEAQNTAAILTTFNEVDMTSIMRLRDQYKDSFEKKYGVKLGFMSFFVKACVDALRAIPSVNGQIENDEIIYKNYYDIGVAVGTEDGLVVPVLRGAEYLNFAEIEKGIADLGKKARDKKLAVADLTGGTFTISNGGIYGSLMSTPILNPPQSGILGMHKIQNRPVAIGDKIEIRPMMYLALSYDHRIIDGKEAVTFLVKVKDALEDPSRLLLGV